MDESSRWVKVDPEGVAEGQVTTAALKAALAHTDGPSLVEIHSSSQDVEGETKCTL